MSGYEDVGAMLDGMALWVENELAAGHPAKSVAHQAADAARVIAGQAYAAGRGEPVSVWRIGENPVTSVDRLRRYVC